MNPYASEDFDDHEHISFFHDAGTGLRAIVAIHSTAPLGIAGGGCRLWRYPNADEALRDALRLSRAMSYKLALVGLPSGGAKCVILAREHEQPTEATWRALGRAIHRLAGRFIAAEDVGTTPATLEIVRRETPYVVAHALETDTAATTAEGVAIAIRTAARHRGRSMDGLRVMVQGVGRVGAHLARILHNEGARLYLSDLQDERARTVAEEVSASVVSPERSLDADVDVYAPCALGDALDVAAVTRLRATIVAGSANNPLRDAATAEALHQRGVLYCPDFIANAGGVIGAARAGAAGVGPFVEFMPSLDRIRILLEEVFAESERSRCSTEVIATSRARAALGRWHDGERHASASPGAPSHATS